MLLEQVDMETEAVLRAVVYQLALAEAQVVVAIIAAHQTLLLVDL
jgi:hypothetical protein